MVLPFRTRFGCSLALAIAVGVLPMSEGARPHLSPSADDRVRWSSRPASHTHAKIEHFVVLLMENHAADNLFGCMDLDGFDGIRGHSIPADPLHPEAGVVNISCGTAPYVCTAGPAYDTFAAKFAPSGAQPHRYPYSEQDDRFSAAHGAVSGGVAVRMFSAAQLPVKAALARSFGVFNKLYTAVPSASSPNHLFAQSATSCGMQANALYNDCGGPSVTFPQPTIYDSMRSHNVSFGLYLNSTCGLDGHPCKGEDPHDPDSASASSTPDVAMEGVARHKDRFFSQTLFYEQAASGTLPAFSWLLPPIQACDHPCHDVAKGERLLKDVYEALRAGPAWERTLLFVAYDDAGGYYDHVVPPHHGVPADDSPCHVPGVHPKCGEPFDFRRLGLRTSSLLISPWVAKGQVFQEPKGPTTTSQFELSSIPATVKNLFNLPHFLTKRDEWAGSFDELLLDELRGDAPMHLPDAPEPASPWDPPPQAQDDSGPRQTKTDMVSSASSLVGTPMARHCSSWHGGEEAPCRGVDEASLKQKRSMRLLAALTNVVLPDVERVTSVEADRWIAEQWRRWMRTGEPLAMR